MNNTQEKGKLNILVVHNYYQLPGGEDTVVANEMQMLKEHGHKVVFYSRNNSELKEMGVFQKALFPAKMIFNLKTYRDIRQIIKKEKIDIVHVHNTLALISPSVYYAALSMKVPVVQTVHNFRLLCPGATFYRDGHICEDCVEKGLHCAIKHNCYRNSKLQTLACVISMRIHRMTGIYKKINFICLTEFNKEKLLHLKQIDKEKVFVKPNFVKDDADVQIIPGEKRKNQFVFVGRLEKIKGIDFLLKAWKQLGEMVPKLIVCGTGPLDGWCREYVGENKLNVEFRGFVSNTEIRKMLAESKALIFPTRWYEGFPMAIVEAFSVGTPVICSDIGNAGKLIKENSTGLKFQMQNIEEFRNAVEKCLFFHKQGDIQNEFEYSFSEGINYKNLSSIYCAVRRGTDYVR